LVAERGCKKLQQHCCHGPCQATALVLPATVACSILLTTCLTPLPAPILQPPPRFRAGIRGKTLVINLPGKPKSIRETFDEVFQSIPYCIQLMEGPYIETNAAVVPAFRPPAEKRTARPAAAAAAAGEAQGQ
jgi:hypothetical protein